MNNAAEFNARRMWDARIARQPFANLPEAARPLSIEEAYDAQEAYWRLAEPVYGPVAGVKVAAKTGSNFALQGHLVWEHVGHVGGSTIKPVVE